MESFNGEMSSSCIKTTIQKSEEIRVEKIAVLLLTINPHGRHAKINSKQRL